MTQNPENPEKKQVDVNNRALAFLRRAFSPAAAATVAGIPLDSSSRARRVALAKQLYSSCLKHELAAEAASGATSSEIVEALSSPRLTVGLLTVAAELAAFACNPRCGFLYPQVASAAGSLGEALVTWTALPVAASALFGGSGGGSGGGNMGGSSSLKSVGTSPAPPPALLDAIHFIAVRLEEEILFGPGSDLYSAMAAVYSGGASPEMAAAVEAALSAAAARLAARMSRAARVLSSRTMAATATAGTTTTQPSPADFESKCVGLVNSLMDKRYRRRGRRERENDFFSQPPPVT